MEMNEFDKTEFGCVVGAMFATFGHQLSREVLIVWWESLKDIELVDVKRAVAELIRTEPSSYRPVPGRIRQMVEPSTESRAMIAWHELNQAIMMVGSYRNPEFDDPKIAAIVQQHGGWVNICGMGEDQFDTWFRKSFFADYATIESTPGLLPRLTGLTAITNARKEIEVQIGEVIGHAYVPPEDR